MLCKLQSMKPASACYPLRGKLGLARKVQKSFEKDPFLAGLYPWSACLGMITICQESSCRQKYIVLWNAINQILLVKREGECSSERILWEKQFENLKEGRRIVALKKEERMDYRHLLWVERFPIWRREFIRLSKASLAHWINISCAPITYHSLSSLVKKSQLKKNSTVCSDFNSASHSLKSSLVSSLGLGIMSIVSGAKESFWVLREF